MTSMESALKKALQQTPESWKTLSPEQQGIGFQDSVNRLQAWLDELTRKTTS